MIYRFYSFINFYLSSIQQGIQTFHLCHEMFNKYGILEPSSHMPDLDKSEFLWEWSKDHKTLITLNGGNCKQMWELWEFISDNKNPYPYVKFHEDADSLNNTFTGIGIILPEKIYDSAAAIRKGKAYFDRDGELVESNPFNDAVIYSGQTFTDFEKELTLRLKDYALAK